MRRRRRSFPRHEIGDRLRSLAAVPALEYGCHVRDVLLVQRERIDLALREDQPELVPTRRDERAVEQRSNDQPPDRVGTEVVAAADAFPAQLESLDAAGWARTGIDGYPSREVRQVDWIGRHTVHDLHHHVGDVDRVRREVRER